MTKLWPSIHGGESKAEDMLLGRLKRWGFLNARTQVQLIPGRKFRFDVVLEEHKLAIEVDGGVWVHGRHTRGKGFESDAEKSALAQAMGYRVIHITPGMIDTGTAEILIKKGAGR